MFESLLVGLLSGIGGGGAGAIVANLLQRKKTDQERVRRQQVEADVRELQEAAEQYGQQATNDEAYGFSITKLSTNVEINMDGTATYLRKLEGLRVLKANFALPEVPGKFSTAGTVEGPFIRDVTPSPNRLQAIIDKKEGRLTRYSIPISPPWTKNDGDLTFLVEAEIGKSYLMTKAEIEEEYRQDKFKLEYHSTEIRFPTRELELSIKFPRNFKVSCDYGVFFGPGEAQHQLERDRHSKALTFNDLQNRATLRISGPLIGFRYFISWLPSE